MSGFKVNFSVNNQLATPSIHAAALANRPAAGQVGRVFIDSDNPSTGIYRDTGTAWVVIGMPSSPDVDTLQTVTDRGNTTTQSITVGAATAPIATVDVRRTTASLNNANDLGLVSVTNPTIPNAANFSSATNINAVQGTQTLSFAGSATLGNQNVLAAGFFTNTIGSSGAGTITVTQAATVRAPSAIKAFSYFNTNAATTISHNAGILIGQPINSGSAAATVTNNYMLIVSDSTPQVGTINYTNRYGIYQEGASDVNYFAGNVGIGKTNPATTLDVNGAISGTFVNLVANGTTVNEFRSNGLLGIDLTSNLTDDFHLRLLATNSSTQSITANGSIQVYSNGNTSVGAGNNLIFQTNGTGNERARFFQTTGNFAIGSNTDSGQKFQLTGTFRSFGTSTTQVVFEGSNPANPSFIFNGSNNLTTIQNLLTRNFETRTDGSSHFTSNIVSFYSGVYIRTWQQALEFRKAYPGVGGNIGFIFDNDTQGTPPAGSAYKINQYKFSTSEVAFITGEGSFSGSGFGTFGTLTANASAILQADSTTKGFLPPRMTDAQITAITTPATGLMAYSTTQNCPAFYDGTGWRKVSHSPL